MRLITILHKLKGLITKNYLIYKINNRLNGFTPVYKLSIDHPTITFGIEIEFKVDDSKIIELLEFLVNNELCYNRKILDKVEAKSTKGWRLSKEMNGVYEIISPVLKDLEAHWSQISLICNKLTDVGAVTDGDCAFHIHIGSQELFTRGRQWINLRNLYRNLEPLTYLLSAGTDSAIPKQRIEHFAVPLIIADESLYCKGIALNEALIKIENDEDEKYSLTSLYAGKYVGLNLRNLIKESKTIEFRTFNSTLDPTLIQTYIIYVLSIINKSVDQTFRFDDNFFIKNYQVSPSFTPTVQLDPLYILNSLDVIIKDPTIQNRLLWYMKQNNFEIPNYANDVLKGKLSDIKRTRLLN